MLLLRLVLWGLHYDKSNALVSLFINLNKNEVGAWRLTGSVVASTNSKMQ